MTDLATRYASLPAILLADKRFNSVRFAEDRGFTELVVTAYDITWRANPQLEFGDFTVEEAAKRLTHFVDQLEDPEEVILMYPPNPEGLAEANRKNEEIRAFRLAPRSHA